MKCRIMFPQIKNFENFEKNHMKIVLGLRVDSKEFPENCLKNFMLTSGKFQRILKN